MRALLLLLACAAVAPGCRDNASRFTSRGDHFEGTVVTGRFVRAGIKEGSQMCVTLDGNHLQDVPGTLTTSDGRFRATPLRPIPQIWHDPLSTLSFGEGRAQNLVLVATPNGPGTDGQDVLVFLSLMDEGGIEVRLVRGAPRDASQDAGASSGAPPMFGVFSLERREGTCSF